MIDFRRRGQRRTKAQEDADKRIELEYRQRVAANPKERARLARERALQQHRKD